MAVVLGLIVWRGRSRNEAATHPAVGQQLAFAQLEPLSGNAKAISADELRGKVTLMNFWGPWCDFCLREMPHLVRLREKLAERDDVQFLFVSCSPDWRPNTPPALNWTEDLPQLQAHTANLLKQREWNIPTWSDPHGKTRQAFAGLDAWQGYPTTLLIDRDGVIRYATIGYSSGDEDALEGQLLKLLPREP
jgi:cytochrome c biogenesis protein CcmG/thiol:disulfide interchange protein DsbE